MLPANKRTEIPQASVDLIFSQLQEDVAQESIYLKTLHLTVITCQSWLYNFVWKLLKKGT